MIAPLVEGLRKQEYKESIKKAIWGTESYPKLKHLIMKHWLSRDVCHMKEVRTSCSTSKVKDGGGWRMR